MVKICSYASFDAVDWIISTRVASENIGEHSCIQIYPNTFGCHWCRWSVWWISCCRQRNRLSTSFSRPRTNRLINPRTCCVLVSALSYRIILQRVTSTISNHITWQHITSHHAIPHRITSHHIKPHHTTSHHITPHHTTSHRPTTCRSISSGSPITECDSSPKCKPNTQSRSRNSCTS